MKIENKEDIKLFVDSFYRKVKTDELIGPVFNHKIPDDKWEEHLEKMYGFWNTVLFGVRDYQGNPFSHHKSLPIEKEHFERWIKLLTEVIHSEFNGEKAKEILERANKMSLIFQSKLAYIRSNPGLTNIL